MKFNSINVAFAALLISGLSATLAFAGNEAQQEVTYQVQAINELAVSAPTVSLVVNSATAGSAPNVALNSATTYAITTNESNRKITGSIDTAMPDGVTLSVGLAAPSGASSTGLQALSTSATDLVTGISLLNDASKAIQYQLEATSAAGVVPSASKTVTFTITAEEV